MRRQLLVLAIALVRSLAPLAAMRGWGRRLARVRGCWVAFSLVSIKSPSKTPTRKVCRRATAGPNNSGSPSRYGRLLREAGHGRWRSGIRPTPS